MTTTEEHLGRFYIELQAWIDGGCGDGDPFCPRAGLCHNLRIYGRNSGLSWPAHSRLAEALEQSFEVVGLSSSAPFNGGDYGAYNLDTHYTNPARLAWIKEHAEAAKAAGLAVAS